MKAVKICRFGKNLFDDFAFSYRLFLCFVIEYATGKTQIILSDGKRVRIERRLVFDALNPNQP